VATESIEGDGGPAQPSPTIGQCIHAGLSWLEVECNRCKTRASLPLNAIRRPRDTPLWKLEASLKCRSWPFSSDDWRMTLRHFTLE